MTDEKLEPAPGRQVARMAATVVAGFLGCFLVLNTYWSVGGTWGLEWIVGPDVTIPLPLVWVQQVFIVVGILVVLDRAGIWRLPIPGWIRSAGIWSMALAFGAVRLNNLLGDNTAQAQLLFAPAALVLSMLCVTVAVADRGR